MTNKMNYFILKKDLHKFKLQMSKEKRHRLTAKNKDLRFGLEKVKTLTVTIKLKALFIKVGSF